MTNVYHLTLSAPRESRDAIKKFCNSLEKKYTELLQQPTHTDITIMSHFEADKLNLKELVERLNALIIRVPQSMVNTVVSIPEVHANNQSVITEVLLAIPLETLVHNIHEALETSEEILLLNGSITTPHITILSIQDACQEICGELCELANEPQHSWPTVFPCEDFVLYEESSSGEMTPIWRWNIITGISAAAEKP